MRVQVRSLVRCVPLAILITAAGATPQSDAPGRRDAGILDFRKSPYAKLQNVPVSAVKIADGFWSRRRRTAIDKSIPGIIKLLEANGYVDNFRRISGGKNVPRQGPVFTDTDLYKWLEAVAFVLQTEDAPQLFALAEEYVGEIVAIQEPSGYLNTYFVRELEKERLLPETMEQGHELYNLGHMLQAAIAWYRSTGDRRLLDAGIRFADYLTREFGPDKKPLLAGHPQIEMALVELYRTTGDRKYLDLADYILNGDPRLERPLWRIVYTNSGIPFTERKQLEGHAVRSMYAANGAADFYLETGDAKYRETLERLWRDMVNGKMYLTGGLGGRHEGESFGLPYELPNYRAYAETCAAIGNLMWQWRLLHATGEARFMDVFERALYNTVNTALSLDGTHYCYMNPLEHAGVKDPNRHSLHGLVRNTWYRVLCCPPNIQRTLASLPGYFYSTSKDGIYAHLFDNSVLDWKLDDGTPLKITQTTRYPWEGAVEFTLEPAKATEFTFFVRIPGWSASAELTVNDQRAAGTPKPGEYFPIRRRWQAGDKVELALDMTPQLIAAHPRLLENAGRVAVERGPLLYALELLDQSGVDSLHDVALTVGKDAAARFRAEHRPDFLGGVTVLKHPARLQPLASDDQPLYRRVLLGESAAERVARPGRSVELTFIPYSVWANREDSPMLVWVRFAED